MIIVIIVYCAANYLGAAALALAVDILVAVAAVRTGTSQRPAADTLVPRRDPADRLEPELAATQLLLCFLPVWLPKKGVLSQPLCPIPPAAKFTLKQVLSHASQRTVGIASLLCRCWCVARRQAPHHALAHGHVALPRYSYSACCPAHLPLIHAHVAALLRRPETDPWIVSRCAWRVMLVFLQHHSGCAQSHRIRCQAAVHE